MKISLTNPTNNRYYYMSITKNLFGEFELIISRGSTKRKAIIEYLFFNSHIDVLNKFSKLVILRMKRGYIKIP